MQALDSDTSNVGLTVMPQKRHTTTGCQPLKQNYLIGQTKLPVFFSPKGIARLAKFSQFQEQLAKHRKFKFNLPNHP
jgi:hypothetical protein